MTKTRQQWEAEMERLNNKYNLDCFSDSELDSESDEGKEYQYEHRYMTLIQESAGMIKCNEELKRTKFSKYFCNNIIFEK